MNTKFINTFMRIVFVFNEYKFYIKRFGGYANVFSIIQKLLNRNFIDIVMGIVFVFNKNF